MTLFSWFVFSPIKCHHRTTPRFWTQNFRKPYSLYSMCHWVFEEHVTNIWQHKNMALLNCYYMYYKLFIYTHRFQIDELFQHIATVFQCLQRKPVKYCKERILCNQSSIRILLLASIVCLLSRILGVDIEEEETFGQELSLCPVHLYPFVPASKNKSGTVLS